MNSNIKNDEYERIQNLNNNIKINQPIISIIVAMANNRVIGKDNKMPWYLPEDLKHFKEITIGKTVIMGRKTFESIGKPLPGRKNIVISSNKKLKIDGCIVVNTINMALKIVEKEKEVFFIGGANIYSQILEKTDNFYFTFIEKDIQGDTFFPNFNHLNLKLISISNHSNSNYNYNYIHYSRINMI